MGKKKKDTDLFDDYNAPKLAESYKTLTYFDNDQLHFKLFNYLGHISKNIYNSSIYCIQVFNKFKNIIFKQLYFKLKSNPNIDSSDFIKTKLIYYHQVYSNIKQYIQSNNNYIYKIIAEELKISKTNIKNSNIDKLIQFYIWKFKSDSNIYLDVINNFILLDDIVIRIIRSFYTQNYLRTKNEMLEHKKFTIKDTEIINDIKNNNILTWSTGNKYKQLIVSKLNIKLSSDQNYIGRLVYATLGNNYGKLDSTMIGHIISRAYQSYNLYYTLLSKGRKTGQPKFLNKDSTFALTYFNSKISKDIDPITNSLIYNLFAGDYIAKNFSLVLGSEYIKLDKNKYIHKKYLKNLNGKKITKKSNYIYRNKYIEKSSSRIIDSRYIKIQIPKKLENKEIKTVEIIFQNNLPKICITYAINQEIQEKNTDSNKAISIDLGMGNLMSIYDPEGRSKIITGKNISSLNRHLNKAISDAQSKQNYIKVNKLNLKRSNKISSYFNEIIAWLAKEYSNKKEIIIGYNKEWKKGCSMGTNTNRLFYGIPYCKLLTKLKQKLKDKEITLIEESYTSKCDSLGLEKLCKKEEYMGKRINRGLYLSSKGVLINADINGAINIMRKKYELREIKGVNICNPLKVRI
jgi:hypothetical protein